MEYGENPFGFMDGEIDESRRLSSEEARELGWNFLTPERLKESLERSGGVEYRPYRSEIVQGRN